MVSLQFQFQLLLLIHRKTVLFFKLLLATLLSLPANLQILLFLIWITTPPGILVVLCLLFSYCLVFSKFWGMDNGKHQFISNLQRKTFNILPLSVMFCVKCLNILLFLICFLIIKCSFRHPSYSLLNSIIAVVDFYIVIFYLRSGNQLSHINFQSFEQFCITLYLECH